MQKPLNLIPARILVQGEGQGAKTPPLPQAAAGAGPAQRKPGARRAPAPRQPSPPGDALRLCHSASLGASEVTQLSQSGPELQDTE